MRHVETAALHLSGINAQRGAIALPVKVVNRVAMFDCRIRIVYAGSEPEFGSDTTVALIHFITATGKGEPYAGPGNKR